VDGLLYVSDRFSRDHFLLRIMIKAFELDGNVIDIYLRFVPEVIKLVDAPVLYRREKIKR
jgi:hypothetical protein